MPTVDAEVGTHLLLPAGSEAESRRVDVATDLRDGRLFRAKQIPAIVRVHVADTAWAVDGPNFPVTSTSVFPEYRHLEEEGKDEE